MPPLKYIADGFVSDARNLLDDFVTENSMEFTAFSKVWRKHHFSLIYMGRPTKKELNEFTNEIFHLTGKFLLSNSRIYQIGGIYLWYGLYLSQISEPTIRIRITIDQAEILKRIGEFAKANKKRSLLFVLSYLFEVAFEFVALPTLMGPFTRKDSELQQEPSNPVEFEADTGLLDIKQSGILEDIYETLQEYSKLKQSQYPTDEYMKYISQLNTLLTVEDGSSTKESFKMSPSKPRSSKSGIGSRRAQLKSASFSRSIFPHQDSDLNEVTDWDDPTETGEDSDALKPIPKEIQRPRLRVPKRERKIGRPRKNVLEMPVSDDSDSDDGAIKFPTSNLFSEKKHHNEKVRRVRRYYEENPGERKK